MTAMFSKARTLSSFGRLTKAYTKWLSVLQPVLGPNYILHKDAREGVAYIVPQGMEIEVYRKVSGFVALILRYLMIHRQCCMSIRPKVVFS